MCTYPFLKKKKNERFMPITTMKIIMKEKAKEKYIRGKFTISAAAKLAVITLWEMQEYLVSPRYKSDYSIRDLEEDIEVLKHF
jgi:predicted HTH domain antitoxin